jgi:hypothetical protein
MPVQPPKDPTLWENVKSLIGGLLLILVFVVAAIWEVISGTYESLAQHSPTQWLFYIATFVVLLIGIGVSIWLALRLIPLIISMLKSKVFWLIILMLHLPVLGVFGDVGMIVGAVATISIFVYLVYLGVRRVRMIVSRPRGTASPDDAK